MSKTVPTTENHQAPSISGAEDEKLPHVIQGIVGGVLTHFTLHDSQSPHFFSLLVNLVSQCLSFLICRKKITVRIQLQDKQFYEQSSSYF